jgi:hypothetical protein
VKAERKIRKSKQRKKGTEKTSFLTETCLNQALMKIVYRQNYTIQKNVKLLETKFEVVSLKKLESEDNEKDFILV